GAVAARRAGEPVPARAGLAGKTAQRPGPGAQRGATQGRPLRHAYAGGKQRTQRAHSPSAPQARPLHRGNAARRRLSAGPAAVGSVMSLQGRLLWSLGVAFVLLWLLAAGVLYVDLSRRLSATLDQRLAASGR